MVSKNENYNEGIYDSRDPAGYPSDSPPGPFFIPLCAQPFSGWCVPAAAARSGSCGRSPPSCPAHRYG